MALAATLGGDDLERSLAGSDCHAAPSGLDAAVTWDLALLEEALRRRIASGEIAPELAPSLAEPRYVLNLGGFVNACFAIDIEELALLVKLTDRSDAGGLRRWHSLAEPLHASYRAPEVLGWIDLPEVAAAGLVLRRLSGAPGAGSGLRDAAWALANELSVDGEIRAGLPAEAETCADYFEETWIDCLREDLKELETHPERPPWVGAHLWRWMREETERVLELARASPAFQEPVTGPVHGDLWEGNILSGPSDWAVIDWDDLALGDLAKDLVDLYWVEGEGSLAGPTPPQRALAARVPLWQRVRLLIDAADSLADWTEAAVVPAHRDAVRDEKRGVHERALSAYQDRYP